MVRDTANDKRTAAPRASSNFSSEEYFFETGYSSDFFLYSVICMLLDAFANFADMWIRHINRDS